MAKLCECGNEKSPKAKRCIKCHVKSNNKIRAINARKRRALRKRRKAYSAEFPVPKDKLSQRGGAVASNVYKRKLDALFKDGEFVLIKELFMPPGETIATVQGHQAKHVWILRDIRTGNVYVVGEKLLYSIRKEYHNVTLPKKKTGRPLGSKNKSTVKRELEIYFKNAKLEGNLFDRPGE